MGIIQFKVLKVFIIFKKYKSHLKNKNKFCFKEEFNHILKQK